jgi:multiple sugar transport system substrate-binding protein
MPTLTSTAAEWKKQYPQYTAFIDEAKDAQGVPTKEGTADVITAFDQKLGSLKTTDVKTLLSGVQKNMSAALKQ